MSSSTAASSYRHTFHTHMQLKMLLLLLFLLWTLPVYITLQSRQYLAAGVKPPQQL